MLCVAIGVGVEHCAVDTLATIFLVNEALITVDYHHKVIVILHACAVAAVVTSITAIVIKGVFATQVGDCISYPISVPTFVGDFLLKLLSRVERTPEDIGRTLRVVAVRRHHHLAIRGAGVNHRAINAVTGNANLGNAGLGQVTNSLLDTLGQHLRVGCANHLDSSLLVTTNNGIRKLWQSLCNLVNGNSLLVCAAFLLPAHIRNHDTLLQKVVCTQLHLLAEVRDVALTHPLEERRNNSRSSHACLASRECLDVAAV